MSEFDELKKEVLDSQLAGQSNWTEETKIAFSIERIKKLKKKLEEFERLCGQMTDKVDKKIGKLKENWRIDETIEEIGKLESAVKIAFDVPLSYVDHSLEEIRKIRNPFEEEMK
ncbi:MAG TPA: hypothetical protein VIH27_03335 [Nitrososphaerales archaeon]